MCESWLERGKAERSVAILLTRVRTTLPQRGRGGLDRQRVEERRVKNKKNKKRIKGGEGEEIKEEDRGAKGGQGEANEEGKAQ